MQLPTAVAILLIFLATASFQRHYDRNRRPKIMGEMLPYQLLIPRRRMVQHNIVKYHNIFRTRVTPKAANMLRMTWHRQAAIAAQKWANKCMFLTHDNVKGRFTRNYGSCGQNIFISSQKVPWLFAIKTWYIEKEHFTYGSTENDPMKIGHYTQMVWAASHEIGCGLAKCSGPANSTMHTYYSYICNYCPIGNVPIKLGFPYKKGRPCSSCEKSCHIKKLCTNSCPVANYWANCKELYAVWPRWLCHTNTREGRERMQDCKATCLCHSRIHDE